MAAAPLTSSLPQLCAPAPQHLCTAAKSTPSLPCALHKRPPRKPCPALPPPVRSGRLLVRLAPTQTGMFRFLLEAYDNLAYFSVLHRQEALLKIVFSPHREQAVRAALAEIAQSLPLEVREWPKAPPETEASNSE